MLYIQSMKNERTITLVKQNECIYISIDILLSMNKSYSYTLRDSKNMNRVYYTSNEVKYIKVLNRLYDKEFKIKELK